MHSICAGDMKVSESATSDIDESSAIAAVACSSTGSTEVAPKKCEFIVSIAIENVCGA